MLPAARGLERKPQAAPPDQRRPEVNRRNHR